MRPVRKLDVLVPAILDDTRWHLPTVRYRSRCRSQFRSRSRACDLLSLLVFILILVVILRHSRRLPLFRSTCAACWGFLAPRGFTSAIADDGPELLHLRAWHHFVACAAKHEHGDPWWEFGGLSWCASSTRYVSPYPEHTFSHSSRGFYLEIRFPLLVAEEGERAQPRHRRRDKPWEGHECVLDDERGDL